MELSGDSEEIGASLAFAGTPEFAAASLRRLLDTDFSVNLVLTQPDRPAGRGRTVTPSAVKSVALEAGLRVLTPASTKSPGLAQQLGPAPDLMIVAAYGLLLPRWLLQWPRLGCVNVHASLLPRWRGAAPIQRAILAGDSETGISLMAMAEGLDTGPVYQRIAVPIEAGQTAADLQDLLATLGAETLVKALPAILEGTLTAQPQPEGEATYANKISKQEAPLDWRRSAVELARQVWAFNPWPVAETRLGELRLRIWQAQPLLSAAPAERPGTILSVAATGIDVATGEGSLRINTVQLPGGKPISAAEFSNGYPGVSGQRLGN